MVSLGAALVTALASNRIHNYLSYPAGKSFLDILDNEKVDNASAQTSLTRMYLSALDTNMVLNDNRAKLLAASGNLITIGFALIVIRYVLEKLIG